MNFILVRRSFMYIWFLKKLFSLRNENFVLPHKKRCHPMSCVGTKIDLKGCKTRKQQRKIRLNIKNRKFLTHENFC